MDTALPSKFPFILDRNLAKANCTGNHVCTSCDKVVLDPGIFDTFINKLVYMMTSFIYLGIFGAFINILRYI